MILYVNQYIQEHPDIVSTYLRNERSLKAQRKQMHVRSLVNKCTLKMVLFYLVLYMITKHGEEKGAPIRFNPSQ